MYSGSMLEVIRAADQMDHWSRSGLWVCQMGWTMQKFWWLMFLWSVLSHYLFHVLFIVDQNKNKSKASSCKQKPQPQPPQPPESFGSQKVVLTSFLQDEKKEQNIKQLRQLLTESNHRFQGIAIVIQQVLDRVGKHCLDTQRLNADIWLNMLLLVRSGRGLEKTKSDVVSAKLY